MVVDKDITVRQDLITRYSKSVRPHLIGRYDQELMYRASSIEQAQQKIEDGLDLHMIVFSEGFSESGIDKLREWLSFREQAILFVILRLPAKVA
jgi:hypothetical protein